jgi:hypothetical protein
MGNNNDLSHDRLHKEIICVIYRAKLLDYERARVFKPERVGGCLTMGVSCSRSLIEEGENKPYGVGSDPTKLTFYVRRTANTPPARQENNRAMVMRNNNAHVQTHNY